MFFIGSEMTVILIDGGPLTALLNPNDKYHDWARVMPLWLNSWPP